MAETVGSHTIATFTSPVNGTTPIDANTVRGNDNVIQTAYNAHDTDTGIHVQSSALASRPAAGTAGRKWITVDGTVQRLWYDTGSVWLEVQAAALSTARTLWGQSFDGSANVSGSLSSVTDIGMSGTLTIGSDVALSRGAANRLDLATGDNLNLVNGAYLIGAASVLSATTLGSGVVNSSLTSVGTLTSGAIGSGFGPIANSALANSSVTVNGVSIALGASGTVAAAAGTLTGSTLASGVTASSLTSVGTLTSLAVSGNGVLQTINGSASAFTDYRIGGVSQARVGTQNFATGDLSLLTLTSAPVVFGTNNTERMRLDASGNLAVDTNTLYVDATNNRVGVGTASPTYIGQVLAPAGSQPIFQAAQTGISNGYQINSNGTALLHEWFNTGSAAMTLDRSGNLGLGVTPSAWNAGYRAIEFSTGAAVWAEAGSNSSIYSSTNTTLDAGGTFRYKVVGAATMYNQQVGQHRWFVAPSGGAGSAGASITFTQAMTLDANGNLGVGTASPLARLHLETNSTTTATNMRIVGGSADTSTTGLSGGAVIFLRNLNTTDNTYSGIYSADAGDNVTSGIVFQNNSDANNEGTIAFITRPSGGVNTERARLHAAGGLSLGQTTLTTGNLLTVSQATEGTVAAFGTNDTSRFLRIVTGTNAGIGGALVSIVTESAEGALAFRTANTERNRIKRGGQFRFVPLAAAPTNEVEDGDVYYDSGTNKLRVRAGGAWVDLH